MASSQKTANFAHATALVRRISTLPLGSCQIQNTSFYRGRNMWNMYTQRIFEAAKFFTVEGEEKRSGAASFASRAKAHLILMLLFFVSLAAGLSALIRRPKVLIFSVDKATGVGGGDVRLASLYRGLEKNGMRSLEVFHTVPGNVTLQNMRTRKRLGIYLEAIYWFANILPLKRTIVPSASDLQKWSELFPDTYEREFVTKTAISTLQQIPISKRTIVFFRILLKCLRPQIIFAIDDVRNYHEFVAAANLEGIPCYGVQHGQFSKYHLGWFRSPEMEGDIFKPNALLVWSEYWKKVLIDSDTYFRPEELIVAGSSEKKRAFAPPPLKGKGDPISVLIPYEGWAPREAVKRHIERFLTCPNVTVYFKLRPGLSTESQLATYNLATISHPHFNAIEDMSSVMPTIDIVAGVHSTLLYESVEAGKRVALLESPLDYGRRIVEDGLAEEIVFSEDPETALGRVMNVREHELVRRAKIIATDRSLQDTLLSMLSKKQK